MNDRFNTIAGWVLGGGIVLLGASLVTGEIFHGGRPDIMGYPIAGVTGAKGEGEQEQPLALLLNEVDAATGENVFKGRCQTCHTITPGGAAGTGPNVHGIMGAPIAGGAFAYSGSLKEKGGTWTWEAMNDWIRNPKGFASGTKMSFAGLDDPKTRAALLVYLNTQGGKLQLPPKPEAAPAGGEAGNAAAPAGNGAAAVPAVPGAAPDQPVLNEATAGEKGGGEANPRATNPGGGPN